MADKNVTKIIDLKIKGAEALDTIEKLSKELEIQKNKLKELNAEAKAGNGLSKEQKEDMLLAAAASKQLQKELNAQTNVLKNNVAESRAISGSLQEMRAQYNSLKVSYEGMSKVQRDAMIPQMKDLKNRIEEADKAIGNYGTSVGNYEQAIANAIPGFGKFQQVISGLGITADQTAQVMAKNVVTSLRAVGSSMKALMANPLIAGIAVILTTILAIKEAIGKNQQAMDALEKVFAPFKVIVDAFFRGLGEAIGAITEGFAKFMEFITPANGALNDSIKAQKILQEIRKEDIKDLELNAKGNLKIAELRDKLLQKETFSAKQRTQFAKEIRAELQRQADDEVNDAKRKVQAFELTNKLAIKNKTLTDAELLQYQQLKSAIDNAKQAQLERGRAATKAANAAIAEINNEAEAAKKAEQEKRKEYAETAKRRKEIQRSIGRQLEDLLISQYNFEKERELAESELKYKRQIADIKRQLATDKDLTVQAKKDLNKIILLLEEKQKTDSKAIGEKYSKATDAENEANAKKNLETFAKFETAFREKIEKMKADAAEKEKARLAINAQSEYDLKQIQAKTQAEADRIALENEYNQKIEAAKKVGADTVAIEKWYSEAKLQIKKAETDTALSRASQFAGNIAAIAGKQTKVGKLAASAQIAIDTLQGSIKAYNALASIPIVGIPLAIAAAGATVAAGNSAIKKVWKVQSGLPGDSSGGGSGASVSATPASTPSTPAQPNYTTTTLNLGSSDTGSRSAQSSQSDAIKSAIKEAYASMPAPVVKVTDIQNASVAADNIKNVSVI